ncbi:MAG: TIGR03960 family B12-binding radical SAM protein [Smithellaceae bacterium]|nr:TIGR03960 family B12-binding radical SAM protein [Smithellaceae bacterium]
MKLEDILILVEKPSRYTGGEANYRKDRSPGRANFVLAFPDTYEVGMSHLGMQILYGILNNLSGVTADRCYAPWIDLEAQLRRRGMPLTALESRRPLKDFHVVGFSLQYELSYTNILNMLELGGIPLRRGDRKEKDPLVIAGGPGAFNPAPLTDFIDAFVIGEGEEVVREIAGAVLAGKERNLDRREMLSSLAEIHGVYVPGVSSPDKPVKKRIVADLDEAFFPSEPLVPLMKTIHDRIVAEISRGCTRGCRFCQAGMVWRPVRERSVSRLVTITDDMLCATGYDELSLLSLSAGDHTRIEEILSCLMERYSDRRVALALPSLRTETLSRSMMEQIKRVRKTSFTLAPEAGTQRMRDIINKGNSDEDLLSTSAQVFEAGWKAMKLYFMVGLPGETREDLEGIVDLGYRVLKAAKPRGQVTIGLSAFVPKPHTPFQWERQLSLAESRTRQDFIKDRLRGRNLAVRWQDSRMSLLEGLLSRGDEGIGRLIERAFYLGCRFDGWSEMFRFDLWEEAIRTEGIAIDDYLAERTPGALLPWQMVDCGIAERYLLQERDRSITGSLTEDCRHGSCQACGVCDGERIKIVLAPDHPAESIPTPATSKIPAVADRFRLLFRKTNMARLLSHLEVSTALIRAMTRAGVMFLFSQGFHPHPKISFAHATSVGMESLGEYMDAEMEMPREETSDLLERINRFLPAGLEIINMDRIENQAPSLARSIAGFRYEIDLPDSADGLPLEEMTEKIRNFLGQENYLVIRESSSGTTRKDIRPLVRDLELKQEERQIRLTVAYGSEGSVRPWDILSQVLGIPDETAKLALVRKVSTIFTTAQ